MRDVCKNVLKIGGDTNDVDAFVSMAKNVYENIYDCEVQTDFSLEKFLPLPAELASPCAPVSIKEEMDFVAKHGGGYDDFAWMREHWGVLRDIENAYYNAEAKSFYFLTDFRPPLAGIRNISALYPSIMFDFESVSFNHDDDPELADYTRRRYKGGCEEILETGKVRIMICPCCGHPDAYARVSK